MKNLFLFILLGITTPIFSQDRYIVFFKDKASSPYTISNPSAYLSQRAIDRRTRMGIAIDSSDLPVNPNYLQAVVNSGAKILNQSRWFNSVTIQADTNQVLNIAQNSFVKNYQKVFGSNLFRAQRKNKFDEFYESEKTTVNNLNFNGSYGGAENQIKMIGADVLHQSNFSGRNSIIAVIDAGFRNTNTHKAFDSLRLQNRILGTWDFSRNDAYVYDFSNHGTSVLSCIAANVPDSMIGTAPHASFYLLRSEEEATEYLVEEYNWAAAAEFADSAGADIINSSLGYTEYDARSQSYTYQDMDGNTAIISIAAKTAVSKGVLVVNSAGNSGSSSWYFIGAPADVEEVFSIGALAPDRSLAGFSSRGPNANGSIKPDVVAQGGPAFIARANTGSYGFGSGTSFSGPIIAGFAACSWELYKTIYPNSKPSQVIQWIKTNANNANNPNNDIGYGLPDAAKMFLNLSVERNKNKQFGVYPNPSNGQLFFLFNTVQNENFELQLYNLIGESIYLANFNAIELINGIELPANISRGMYIISIQSSVSSYKTRLVIE